MKHEVNLDVNEVTVIISGNFAYCYKNAGESYGGVSERVVDLSDCPAGGLADWLDKYVGKIYGDYIREQE